MVHRLYETSVPVSIRRGPERSLVARDDSDVESVKLSGQSRSKPRLEFLDTLRGFAILGVFAYHAAWLVSGNPVVWTHGLWSPRAYDLPRSLLQYALQCNAVPGMFFLISGFLIHRSAAAGRAITLGYMGRRNLRLYLPYLLVLAACSAVYYCPWPPPWVRPDLRELVLHVLLVFNLAGAEPSYAINPSFWFVAAEIQISFAYLILARIIGRTGWLVPMSVLFALQVVTRILAYPDDGWYFVTPFSYVFTWMLGALLAHLHAVDSLPRRCMLKGMACAIVLVLATAVEALQYVAQMAYAGLAFFVIAWALRRRPYTQGSPARSFGGLRRRVVMALRGTGRISLWAYLINQPVLFYVEWVLEPRVPNPVMRILASTVVGAAVVLPLAWLLQRYSEPRLARLADTVASAAATIPGLRKAARSRKR
jgi:peptidoglycan/LPS O-acetylase OafA/YrhL